MARDRVRVTTPVGTTSRTKQSFRDSCDVNLVLAKFAQTGELPPGRNTPASYGDFSDATDLQTSIEMVREANREFNALPSSVRFASGNSPVQFLQMLNTEEGQITLQESGMALGLDLEPEVAEATPVVENAAGAATGGSEGE